MYQILGLFRFSLGRGVRHKQTNTDIRPNIGISTAYARHVDSIDLEYEWVQ